MSLDTFFDKFHLFADTPNAVEKMREVVLTLAVQGKLVDQDSEDEPSSKLIEHIEKQKGTTHQPISNESAPYQSPTNWIWVKLGFLAEIERGGSPRPIKDYITDDPEGLNWIKIGDTEKGGKYITSTQEKIRKEGLKKTRRVYPGDFLLTNSMSFGRPYISKIEGCIHDGWLRIHPPRQILPEYLYHLLSSSSVYAFFCKSAAGAVVQNLNADKVRELPIPLPPLAEQRRIVAKVDELMALCDRLEEQQRERDTRHAVLARASLARFAEAPTPANLNLLFHPSFTIPPADLRKAILTMAFQGDLTKDLEKTESENDSQHVISKAIVSRRHFWEKRYGVRRKIPEPETCESENLPRIPNHWIWVSIDSVCAQITDGEHIQPPYQIEGIPMLSAKHVRDGYVTLKGAGLITEEAFQKSIERCQPENGDILIVSVGATTGRSAIVENCPRFAIVRSVLLIKPVILKAYLHYWLKNSWAFIWMTQASGASAQQHLYIRDLKRMPVPIPPLAEQRRIVARVDQLMALVDQLESQLATARSTATRLMEALVAELTSLQ